MLKAGAIVFAPHDGGQAEILDNPDLLFTDEADAVGKIQRVLESASLQSALHSTLRRRAQSFSTSSFISNVRGFIENLLNQNGWDEHADEMAHL
jgi:hypothetical protein